MVDADARWVVEAEMAQWLFDNSLLYTTSALWPLGPNLDLWEPMALSQD